MREGSQRHSMEMRTGKDEASNWVRDELDRHFRCVQAELRVQFWRIVAGVALMVHVHILGTWAIVAAYAELAR